MSIKDRYNDIKWFTITSIGYMNGVYSNNKYINLLYILPQLPFRYYKYLKVF